MAGEARTRRRCDVCRKGGRIAAAAAATYRVTFGVYAGSWSVCDVHLQSLLTSELPSCVVRDGMTCTISRFVDDGRPEQRIATIRRKLA